MAPFQKRPVSASSAVAVVLPAIPSDLTWSNASTYLSLVNAGTPARRIGSFELFGDFVEPGLDARLVDAGRAGDADPGNNLVAEFNRQPAGNGDDVGQGYLLAHHRVVVGEALGVGGGRGAKAARGIGFAPSVLHRMRAGIVGAHRDNDFAGAIDHNGRDGVALGRAAVDRRFRDRLSHRRSGRRKISLGRSPAKGRANET